MLERFTFGYWGTHWTLEHHQEGVFAPYTTPGPVKYDHAKQSLDLIISTWWLPIPNTSNMVKVDSYYIPSLPGGPGFMLLSPKYASLRIPQAPNSKWHPSYKLQDCEVWYIFFLLRMVNLPATLQSVHLTLSMTVDYLSMLLMPFFHVWHTMFCCLRLFPFEKWKNFPFFVTEAPHNVASLELLVQSCLSFCFEISKITIRHAVIRKWLVIGWLYVAWREALTIFL